MEFYKDDRIKIHLQKPSLHNFVRGYFAGCGIGFTEGPIATSVVTRQVPEWFLTASRTQHQDSWGINPDYDDTASNNDTISEDGSGISGGSSTQISTGNQEEDRQQEQQEGQIAFNEKPHDLLSYKESKHRLWITAPQLNTVALYNAFSFLDNRELQSIRHRPNTNDYASGKLLQLAFVSFTTINAMYTYFGYVTATTPSWSVGLK